MLTRTLLLAPLALASLPGCVLSVSPLPPAYGPPQWTCPQTATTVVSTPAPQAYPPSTEPDPGALRAAPSDSPPQPLPPAIEQPTGTRSPRRAGASPRRVCGLE